jgi:hypothetical protein
MKTLIGGAVGALVGLMFLVILRESFFDLLKGTIPFALLLGGGLALYLGFDELKETWDNEDPDDAPQPDKDKEIEDLKNEIETLKKS